MVTYRLFVKDRKNATSKMQTVSAARDSKKLCQDVIMKFQEVLRNAYPLYEGAEAHLEFSPARGAPEVLRKYKASHSMTGTASERNGWYWDNQL